MSPGFEVGEVRPLFDAQSFALDAFHQGYDVFPGGRGFVALRERRLGQAATAPPIVYAENWFADVRTRVGR